MNDRPTQGAPAAARRPDALKLAQQYAALTEDKRTLFRARARSQGLGADALPVVPLAPRPARFPLLFAQERLWFLWCLDPQHAGYHITHTLQIKGAFDVTALRHALDQLLLRHEALRLRFEAVDGVPMQYPAADATYGFVHRVFADDSESLESALHDFACAPFDLINGPVLRVALFETRDGRRVLQFVVHHIVADAWSMDVLFRDLLALYHGEQHLPALPVQLADVAQWQREWAANDALETQINYWREQLAGAPAALTLPRDVPPRATRSHDGGLVRLTIPATLADTLRELARGQRTTLFTLLLAVFDILLCRYSGQRTVVVGVPTAGRGRTELEGLVGFLVNTLIVRADLNGSQSFDALLRGLHERVLEAQAHQDVPFAKLVEALAVERDLDSSPLFQVMFDLAADDARAQSTESDGTDSLSFESIVDVAPTARFDLALNARDRGTGDTLQLALTYSRDRFVEATAQRLLTDYVALLEQIAAQPGRKVGDLALRRGSHESSEDIARGQFRAAHQRVAERARQCPARIALRCEGAELTYAKLDAWSDRIALALRADGLVAGERVGLLLERSLALPVSLLAVFKAGGAFVPLDPEYPQARLQTMIADAGVTRVIIDAGTRQSCADLLTPLRALHASELRTTSAVRIDADAWHVRPDALAYVIYTSGSTGTPKGVAVSHRSLALHLEDFLHDHRVSESDIVLQSSTINFDVALHELLPALIAGGRVVMRGPQPWELASLNRTLCDERVSFARIPTALWQQWRMALPPADRIALRQITVGGEALPGDALQRWYEGPLAHVAINNLYGPTETTVAALHHPVSRDDAQQAIVAIGRCYPARHAYVADLDGNRAPDGALGELCIGGATLAQGYLARPGLTAERFVPDPYGAPGSRVYRSGDLCRARADGTIDFLGRIDQQVKLRGHRIELGEIEVALRRIDGVREAVVELRGEGERKRLVAYFTGTAQPDAVREVLTQTLPASHVPSVCMALGALPTLPNGKLDRRALPEPDDTLQSEVVAPDGAVETTLLTVWQSVLGRDDFGVTDNFFTLGGDSILSLRVIAQARAVGWIVSPRQVFEHPTVRGLARVAQADAESSNSQTVSSAYFYALEEYARLPEHLSELGWWQKQLGVSENEWVPTSRAANTTQDTLQRMWTFGLSHQVERIDEIVLAALVHSLAEHMPHMPLIVELEVDVSDQRVNGVDMSGLIKRFGGRYPLRLAPSARLETTRDDIAVLLDTVPARGMHFAMLRTKGSESTRAVLEALPRPTIGLKHIDETASIKEQALTHHLLDLESTFENDTLTIRFRADSHAFSATNLNEIVATFDTHVHALANSNQVASVKTHVSQRQYLFDGLGALPHHVQPEAAKAATKPGEFDAWCLRYDTESMLCAPYGAESDPDMQPLNASGAPVTLFCLYPSVGVVGDYRFLADVLQGTASVVALRGPGFARDGGELHHTPPTSFEALAELCLKRVLKAQPTGPYRLLGWSFGGRVAVAVAGMLRALGHEVDFLGLLDTATRAKEAQQDDYSDPAALSAWLDQHQASPQLRTLFERTAELDALCYRLHFGYTPPTLDVPITFWRATRDKADARERDWHQYTRAGVEEVCIDEIHSRIVHHPEMHEGVKERLHKLAMQQKAAAQTHNNHDVHRESESNTETATSSYPL